MVSHSKFISSSIIFKIDILLKDQLKQHDWQTAEENLLKAQGLGSLKHRKQVLFSQLMQKKFKYLEIHISFDFLGQKFI